MDAATFLVATVGWHGRIEARRQQALRTQRCAGAPQHRCASLWATVNWNLEQQKMPGSIPARSAPANETDDLAAAAIPPDDPIIRAVAREPIRCWNIEPKVVDGEAMNRLGLLHRDGRGTPRTA